MGTRNLTMLIMDNKPRIAQYGQWDGNPSGQGITVLKFLQRLEKYPTVKKSFMAKLKRVKFIDAEKQKEIDIWLESIGVKNGWLNMEQANLYHMKYPLLTRDHGANILPLVYDQKGRDTIWLHDSSDFVTDGLFNEWTYVIDLDKRVLEVYHGFAKTMPPKDNRFYNQIVESEAKEKEELLTWDRRQIELNEKGLTPEQIEKAIGRRPYVRDEPYYIELMHTFNIDELPTQEEFLAILEPNEEENE